MTDGVWQMGWAQNKERCAVWHHYTGAVWSWVVDRNPPDDPDWDGAETFKLAVRPAGRGKPKVLAGDMPIDLYSWVLAGDPPDPPGPS